MGRTAEGQALFTVEALSGGLAERTRSGGRRFSRGELPQRRRVTAALATACLACLLAVGCVSPADHRKLENRVADLARSGRRGNPSPQYAEMTAELQSLRAEVANLRGRIDIAERQAAEALAQAGRARRELAAAAGKPLEGSPSSSRSDGSSGQEAEAGSDELRTYRSSYAAWRSEDYNGCIDQFRKFLQTYPASGYADDAAYWMADCHFKQEDYRNAVLRFDDVVRNYPTGNKAPDALYRQGESLLKLGPGFREAARRAFDRVIKEYPGTPAARQAAEQLEAMGTR